MKNYDIKSATAELSLGQKIVVNGKRLAFLVPNMFNRIRKGFNGKVQSLKQAVNTEEIKNVYQEAVARVEEKKEEKIANIEEKVEKKEEAIVQTKANENIADNTKSYIIKAYESDIQHLKEKTTRVSASPRRLLISTIFLQKLIVNRKNKIVKNIAERKIEKQLEKIPTVENSIEAATTEYIELSNKREELVREIREIEKMMRDLVVKNGLTRDMIENTNGKTK